MIRIEKDYSLKKLNTFGIDAIATEYVRISTSSDLSTFIHSREIPSNRLVLGCGSNLLFIGDTERLIIHPEIMGINILREDEDSVDMQVGCGETWDIFVDYCCRKEYSGLENLSLIPGSVGAAPVQNIGAYGVEVKDRILWIEGVDSETGETHRLTTRECNFGYRSSIFKLEHGNRIIITNVVFRLDKKPRFVLNYGTVAEEFSKMSLQTPSSLRQCIIRIRESKLPDPEKYGNAGSFFKNPVIPFRKFTHLKERYPNLPSYPEGICVKIPAAWLIEQAGWKGVREKDTGTWPTQPLVIVNYGNATGKEIFDFSTKIMTSVKEKFGIELEREVQLV